jgi:hypothetical protein
MLHQLCNQPLAASAGHRVSPVLEFRSAFSTTATRATYSDKKVPASRSGAEIRSTTSRNGTKSGPGDAGVDTEMPAVSFESLGIGRNMKVVLLVVLGVFGSIETVFWCKAVWIWWKKGDVDIDVGIDDGATDQ